MCKCKWKHKYFFLEKWQVILVCDLYKFVSWKMGKCMVFILNILIKSYI